MLPFRRILFPVDYSEACNLIVPSVARMADHFQSEITLLHACPWPVVLYGEMLPASYVVPEVTESDARERLAKFAAEKFPGRTVRQVAVVDDVILAIRNEVERQGTDLLMMPTRGHGVLRRLLLGSTTAKVLHDLSCPVWTGARDSIAADRPCRSIVCALSLDQETPDIARAAAALAKSFGAKLTLLHVVDAQVPGSGLDYGPYVTELMDRGQARLEDLQREYSIKASVAVSEGPIPLRLRETVERESADLVVVGRGHDQDPLGRLWSRLYDIVRESPCPVISI
jgi:nucleotide-binding universal stress UspA family protein